MSPWRTLFVGLLCSCPLHGETFIIDFNDVDDPVLQGGGNVPLRELDVPGGVARDGGILNGGWPTGTSLVDAVQGVGDLSPTAGITGYVAAQGPANPTFGLVIAEFEDDQGRGRMNHRNVTDFAIGTTWLSFLVRLDPDVDGDGDGPVSGGLVLGNLGGYTSSVVAGSAGAFLGLSHLPAGVSGGPATVVEWSSSGLEFNTLTTTGASVKRGTTSADLGLAASDTHLVLARLDEGADTIEVWVNPPNVTDVASLGPATLSASIGFANIEHLGVYGEADESGATTVEHVKASVDNVRLSNEALGLRWVTGSLDPIFEVPPTAFHQDYTLGTSWNGGATRTLEFTVQSVVGNTVTIEGITLPDDGGGVFALGTLPSFPLVLNDGDSIAIPVTASGSPLLEASGQLSIETTTTGALGSDIYDQVLPLSVTFLDGNVRLNGNPFIDESLTGWGGGSVAVVPGLAPASAQGARVRGLGDPHFGNPDSLYQANALPDGASDWELVCTFSPLDVASFVSAVDPSGSRGITGPRGEFTDRTFQLAILASDEDPVNPTLGTAQAAQTVINLAYLPGGASAGGTPDFYLFDGTSGAWVATGLGAIVGSTDANDDGALEASAGDSVNAYTMRIRGTGFGQAGASYDLFLSGGELAAPVAVAGLATFHGISGELTGPAGYAFTTGDVSPSSNAGNGVTPGDRTSFWVDDISYFAGEMPDPYLVIFGSPATIPLVEPQPGGSTTVALRSDGRSATLSLTAFSLAAPGLSLVSGNTPGTLLPGEVRLVGIEFDATAIVPNNLASGVLTVTNDSANLPGATIEVSGTVTSPFQRIPNGNFEVGGVDAAGDTDTFAIWDESINTSPAALVQDVPGLAPGSSTAAFLRGAAGSSSGANGDVEMSLGAGVTDFELDVYFALKSSGRRFNMHLRSDPVTTEMINIRYEAGVWSAYGAPGGGTGWKPLLDLTNGGANSDPILVSVDAGDDGRLDGPGDTAHVYRLRVTGSGFGTPAASYAIEVFDEDDVTSLGQSTPSDLFRASNASTDPLGVIRFTTRYGGDLGFWVDDVSLRDPGYEALDSDGDGMTDAYERANGLAPYDPSDAASDADRDGLTALDESVYGTDPNDAASRFTVTTEGLANGQTRITYGPLLEGNVYWLSASAGLEIFSIIDNYTARPADAGTFRVVLDPSRMKREFYKVVVNCE